MTREPDDDGPRNRTEEGETVGRPEREARASADDDGYSETAGPEDVGLVLDLLGNDIRRDIVLSLARLSTQQWGRGAVAYADLRTAVGIEDGGKFNYHLGKLQDVLVETDDEDAYRLTTVGQRVAYAMLSGRLTGGERVTAETHACPHCEGAVTMTCTNGYVTMTCPEHGLLFDMALPPTAASAHDPVVIARLAMKRATWFAELAMDGCCEYCWGAVDARAPVPSGETPIAIEDTLFVEFRCERCETTFWLTPGACVLRHPAVVAFCHDRGEAVTDAPLFGLAFTAPTYPHVEATDDGLAITLVRDDDALRVELDEAATVVAAIRLPAAEVRPSGSSKA
jgi:hypothetical protein